MTHIVDQSEWNLFSRQVWTRCIKRVISDSDTTRVQQLRGLGSDGWFWISRLYLNSLNAAWESDLRSVRLSQLYSHIPEQQEKGNWRSEVTFQLPEVTPDLRPLKTLKTDLWRQHRYDVKQEVRYCSAEIREEMNNSQNWWYVSWKYLKNQSTKEMSIKTKHTNQSTNNYEGFTLVKSHVCYTCDGVTLGTMRFFTLVRNNDREE